MDRIFEEEIVPLEVRMEEVELQLLDEVEQLERGLRQELRTVRAEIGPMRDQLEDQLLTLLEEALVPIAEQAATAAP